MIVCSVCEKEIKKYSLSVAKTLKTTAGGVGYHKYQGSPVCNKCYAKIKEVN